MKFNVVDDSTVEIFINSELYSSEVIHKCFYWYCNKYSIDINLEDKLFNIVISNINGQTEIESILKKIKIDLVDFKTRQIIFNETKNIREMLIAKAFAHHDNFDEPLLGEIDDPVGFNSPII